MATPTRSKRRQAHALEVKLKQCNDI